MLVLMYEFTLNLNRGKNSEVSYAGTTTKGENSDLSHMQFGENVTLFCTVFFFKGNITYPHIPVSKCLSKKVPEFNIRVYTFYL